jgi:hypothetical protein
MGHQPKTRMKSRRNCKTEKSGENKREAEVIRDLVRTGLDASRRTHQETTGEALLRLARLGEKLKVKAPADLSSRIDDYVYGDE